MTTTTPRRRRRWVAGLAVTGLVALLGAGTLATHGWTGSDSAAAPVVAESTAAPASSPQAATVLAEGRTSYADLVTKVTPSVVTVRAVRTVHQTMQQFSWPEDPFFRRFFGDPRDLPMPRDRRTGGLGSGVIVSRDGYILTNHHVVKDAEEVTVELSDRRSFPATIVGTDAPSDIAVLKIDSVDLPALALGDSDRARVGDVVLAFGNPLGIGQTVTMGIVSAKGRATGLGDGSFEDFIQTDAAINQGNSGGPLVGIDGSIVGINSQILSPSGGNIGIGFAIPASMARNVMEQLRDHGTVRRGLLGVIVQNVTSDMAQSLGLSEVRGAIVSSVTSGSAADKAGVKQGDVIVAFNGEPVKDNNGLRNAVAGTRPSSSVTLTVLRNGREQQLNATLGELESTRADGADRGEGGTGDRGRYGMALEPLTPELRQRLEVPGSGGVVVRDVDPSAPAGRAGLARGDVILQVNQKPVSSPDEVKQALDAPSDRPALLLVRRGDANLFLTLNKG
jgi:Do/DeqQ family serine protease